MSDISERHRGVMHWEQLDAIENVTHHRARKYHGQPKQLELVGETNLYRDRPVANGQVRDPNAEPRRFENNQELVQVARWHQVAAGEKGNRRHFFTGDMNDLVGHLGYMIKIASLAWEGCLSIAVEFVDYRSMVCYESKILGV